MIVDILYILLAIALLGVLVMVHEFGHYIVGRLTGMTVLEFSIGFGPKLLGWKRKGIDYSLRVVPLGGYCSFLGEDDNNSDPRAMNNQPVWRRFFDGAGRAADELCLCLPHLRGLDDAL